MGTSAILPQSTWPETAPIGANSWQTGPGRTPPAKSISRGKGAAGPRPDRYLPHHARRVRGVVPVAALAWRSYSKTMPIRFIDREEVVRRLTYDVCIPIVRDA